MRCLSATAGTQRFQNSALRAKPCIISTGAGPSHGHRKSSTMQWTEAPSGSVMRGMAFLLSDIGALLLGRGLLRRIRHSCASFLTQLHHTVDREFCSGAAQRMSGERVERKLAAILAADIAGYSRLMGADEEGTHAALKAIRRELGDPMIAEHRGRIFKTTGDGLLAEFTSVVDAVRCAIDLQTAMTGRNTGVVAERRIEFRIGVNVGDVIIDGDDIYGDGVNIAARLEALAEPGGVCI